MSFELPYRIHRKLLLTPIFVGQKVLVLKPWLMIFCKFLVNQLKCLEILKLFKVRSMKRFVSNAFLMY